jgi:hypothetical protein
MSFHSIIIRLNNAIVRRRRLKVAPADVLLLLPHCLHHESCPQDVGRHLDECRRCGKCSLAGLAQVRDDYGVVCGVVGGGRQALERVKSPSIRAIVAVACEKELVSGILAAFPKPVLAVPNRTPEGPCRNTLADIGAVVRALETFTERSTGKRG